MTNYYQNLAATDPEVFAAVQNETRRQHEGLELIASENFTSEAVLEAAGTTFTNKYAEGYPGKRYYGGCEFSDVVENLAIERAKQLLSNDDLPIVEISLRTGFKNQSHFTTLFRKFTNHTPKLWREMKLA